MFLLCLCPVEDPVDDPGPNELVILREFLCRRKGTLDDSGAAEVVEGNLRSSLSGFLYYKLCRNYLDRIAGILAWQRWSVASIFRLGWSRRLLVWCFSHRGIRGLSARETHADYVSASSRTNADVALADRVLAFPAPHRRILRARFQLELQRVLPLSEGHLEL
jgi:hypothetical protein